MRNMGFSDAEYIRIVDLYADSVFKLAMVKTKNKQDAEDVFQDTFIKLYRCDKIFESDEHIKRWLMKVTVNTSLDLLKLFWNRKTEELDEGLPFQDQTYHEVWNEIKKLPERYRVPIHLFYFEGYSTEEIADMLHDKPSTVRSKLHRAKDILSEGMGDRYEWV